MNKNCLQFTVIFFLLLPCAQAFTKESDVFSRYTSYDRSSNLESMDKKAELVLLGQPVKEFKKAKYVITKDRGLVDSFHTIRKFKVVKIRSNKIGAKLKEGQVVNVIESTAMAIENGTHKLHQCIA